MKRKDFITLLSILVLVALSYMGKMYSSFGNLAANAIFEVVILILAAALCIVAVYGRTRKGSYTKFWNITGYLCGLLVFVVGFIFWIPNINHFFHINNEKTSIIDGVKERIRLTDEMFEEYQTLCIDRAEMLKRDINNISEEEFNNLFPGVTKNATFATDHQKAQERVLMNPITPQINEWEELKKNVQEYVIDDWSIIDAPERVHAFVSKIKGYNKDLKETFEDRDNYNPFEKVRAANGKKIVFQKHVEVDSLDNKFITQSFNFLGTFIGFVLLLLSCSTFVFVKINKIKPTEKNNHIFEQGYKL